jgi:hypothetical protein
MTVTPLVDAAKAVTSIATTERDITERMSESPAGRQRRGKRRSNLQGSAV